jgi:alkanesulfonate monooxygenase SsuD/methylene tetrahydromethanopterin reductase-like flavin-dependent oxidoreductase (luciferase family)
MPTVTASSVLERSLPGRNGRTVKFGGVVPQGWRLDLAHISDPIEQNKLMTQYGTDAEKLGYDSMWLDDHLHTWPTTQLEATFACGTSTAVVARGTSTIKIGQMVTCNPYDNPALLAKLASTVDVLSHGRLNFGIGVGWYQEEFTAYGYPCLDGPDAGRNVAGHFGSVDRAIRNVRGPVLPDQWSCQRGEGSAATARPLLDRRKW